MKWSKKSCWFEFGRAKRNPCIPFREDSNTWIINVIYVVWYWQEGSCSSFEYYPWLLFCLSCSDFSILAVTAFPKSLCFISEHRQLLHKICFALVAFFWLFNWSGLKLDAQNFSEAVWEDCAFSMQCKMEKKQEGSVRYLFFLFPLFSLPGEGALIIGIPALCFPQSCCFAVSALMQDLVLYITWSVGEAGLCVGGDRKWVLLGSMSRLQHLVCWGQLPLSLLFVLSCILL